jgi:hypothetical protein
MTDSFGFSGHRKTNSAHPPRLKQKSATEEDHVIVSRVEEYGTNLRMASAAGLPGGTWREY